MGQKSNRSVPIETLFIKLTYQQRKSSRSGAFFFSLTEGIHQMSTIYLRCLIDSLSMTGHTAVDLCLRLYTIRLHH